MVQGDFSFRPYLILTGLLLLPWCLITWNMVGNADNLWLAEGFLRFWSGETLKDSFFEVNPPLSILLYAIPALLSEVCSIPLHHCIFTYTGVAVFLFSLALLWLLKQIPFLCPWDQGVFLIAIIFANTLMTTGFFGERDHFLAMALPLFLLVQMLITLNISCDRRIMSCIAFFAAIFLLLKPHFLLLPAMMIIYRIVKQHNVFSVFRDLDFIALMLAVAGYAVVLLWLFPDYLSQILPAVINYYGRLKEYDVITMMTIQYIISAAGLTVAGRVVIQAQPMRRFIYFLAGMSVLTLVPYIVQGQGYAYHLIPATTLLWAGVGLAIYHLVLKQGTGQRFAFVVTIILCAVGAYAAKPPMATFISHRAYAELPLVKAAADCGHPECRVLIFGPSFEISYLVVYYAGSGLASRFPSMFFLPGQLSSMDIAEEEREIYRAMVAADIMRYKPDIVMLSSFEIVQGSGNFDFINYFGQNADFRNEWGRYSPDGNINVPYDDYLKGTVKTQGQTISFNIYKRRVE